MTVYERYCQIRDAKGFKDADVAKATGIYKSTFSDWKYGRSVPKIEKIQKIADFLSVPVSALMSDDVHTDAPADVYYLNEETSAVAQDIFDDTDLRALFDAAKDSRPQDLKMAAELLRRLKETNKDG